MKLCRITLAMAAGLIAAGCATNEQFVRFPDQSQRVEDPAKGRIYVVRPSSISRASSMEVWDGDRHIGNTGADSYLCWEREPGTAEISGKEENTSTVTFNVVSNQVYYIFQHLRFGWVQARNKLEVIAEEEGQRLLKQCKPPKAGACKDHPECVARSASAQP